MANPLLLRSRSSALTVDVSKNSRILTRLVHVILQSPRYLKRTILVAADVAALTLALWLALYLRHAAFYVPATFLEFALLLAGPLLAAATFGWFGIYRIVTRFFHTSSVTSLIAYFWLSVLLWSVLVFMSGQQGVPRTAIIGFGFIGTFAIISLRQGASLILNLSDIHLPPQPSTSARKPVLIYGAGPFGVRICNALKNGSDFEPVGFVDSSASLRGQYISGLKVFHPDNIARVAERLAANTVLIAIPEAQRSERRIVVEQMKRYPIEVKTLPLIEDIAAGRVKVTNVHPIDVDELLGRDPVPPLPELMAHSIQHKSILVTGAGGSIGAEIVRQVYRHMPRRIVLLDAAEPALYAIDMEVRELLAMTRNSNIAPEITSVLGSTLDANLLRDVLQRHEIQTIYHAAAYKHVPIVESNPITALQNNTFGTTVVAETARAAKVERVVLVSTDKAVRPTNVMGVSKRLSEQIFQAHAADQSETIFTMVRFGNVLDSSGSVVQRFRKQISSGGPVTVTHIDVTRYFMSVREAAELVIQAGSLAKGGEVFVLDMGDPIKIADLAALMIRLAGFQVRDLNNPSGDIEITYAGLRPGEKLYEELLIGAHPQRTAHARIMLAQEPFMQLSDLTRELGALSSAMADRDLLRLQDVMLRLVDGYAPQSTTSGIT